MGGDYKGKGKNRERSASSSQMGNRRGGGQGGRGRGRSGRVRGRGQSRSSGNNGGGRSWRWKDTDNANSSLPSKDDGLEGCSRELMDLGLAKIGELRSKGRIGEGGNRLRKKPKMETTGASVGASKVKEIPGFYYDEEKKKYFKLLPNNRKFESPFERRSSSPAKGKTNLSFNDKDSRRVARCILAKSGLFKLITAREHCIRELNKGIYGSTDVKESLFLLKEGSEKRESANTLSCIDMSSCSNYLLMGSRTGLVQEAVIGKSNEVPNENIDHFSQAANGMDLVSCVQFEPKDHRRGYASSLNGGKFISFGTFEGFNGGIVLTQFRRRSLFCFDVNPWQTTNILFGLDKGALIKDRYSIGRPLYKYNSPSDVLSVAWSSECDPFVFGMGCRNGTISVVDRRLGGVNECGNKISFQTNSSSEGSPSSVTSLKFLSDSNYVLCSSNFSNYISLWDIRMKKEATRYDHGDECTSQISFDFDPEERVIFSAGSDSILKAWDLTSGSLLHHFKLEDKPVDIKCKRSTSNVNGVELCMAYSNYVKFWTYTGSIYKESSSHE
eukprot:Nk52_evm8s2496 gene=Nk52_evmTU8s2496